GCYEGTLAARLAEATGRPVVGVDLTDAGFARAFEQAHRLGVEDLVGCVRQDAHHLSVLGSGRFDVATFTYSLHCMADPERVVAEVVRVLAPGGLLLVVDWVVGPGEPRHGCYRLSAMEVEDMMRRTGLTVLNTVARSGVALVAAEKPLLDAVPRRAALGGQAAQGLPGLPGGVLEPASHVRARR
ncbi:MAG: methyltransferase domain-containing protein, partial [Bacillota bacterium]